MVKNILIKHFFSRNGWWFWPVLAMIAITPWTPALDLAIESYFYAGNGVFSQYPLFTFMYKYGPIPAEIFVLMGTICFILSYFNLETSVRDDKLMRDFDLQSFPDGGRHSRLVKTPPIERDCNSKDFVNLSSSTTVFRFMEALKKWRPIAIILVLTLAIGSGLFTHLIFKDHWGRPRPKQIVEFGGLQEFRPYYIPNLINQREPSKSFPCGHFTMGFYFFAVALIGKRLNRRWLWWTGVFLIHATQVLTYLRLTGIKLGLLINFGNSHIKDGITRIVNRIYD